jgi:hypothetical protein
VTRELFDDAPVRRRVGNRVRADAGPATGGRTRTVRARAIPVRSPNPGRAWRPDRIRPANEGRDSSRRLRNSAQSRQTATSGCCPSRTTCSSGKDDPQHQHSRNPAFTEFLTADTRKSPAFLRGFADVNEIPRFGEIRVCHPAEIPISLFLVPPWVLSTPARESSARPENPAHPGRNRGIRSCRPADCGRRGTKAQPIVPGVRRRAQSGDHGSWTWNCSSCGTVPTRRRPRSCCAPLWMTSVCPTKTSPPQ